VDWDNLVIFALKVLAHLVEDPVEVGHKELDVALGELVIAVLNCLQGLEEVEEFLALFLLLTALEMF
jgi:hypothetical protein